MAKIYYDKDADLKLIKEKTIAIIGYRTISTLGKAGYGGTIN